MKLEVLVLTCLPVHKIAQVLYFLVHSAKTFNFTAFLPCVYRQKVAWYLQLRISGIITRRDFSMVLIEYRTDVKDRLSKGYLSVRLQHLLSAVY